MSNLADNTPQKPKRGWLWHLKWLFACYAASFGLFLLVFVLSLPLSGTAFAEWWFKPIGSLAMLVAAVAVSPVIYRRLR